ncbi:hypothetical protein Pst134EA_007296 [Puccinia striiformis f. sp. tritici]|uniref:hypothetical protein n=1 Tax=Puccinia striiformis f. sp. tritici TaxID=168172 RepID=UPI002008CC9E|nr:hypothetical protein Pst134EA_007282 [Puccinia striiformis f. sp. tritici]XP_047809486.1 hypothetical protein Pst134EA_007296 [Puccinia striiformis f. sp. tritici]KAH9470018.1 hypothetical protein Pst134EA_007282 [Puccinia striiformis f. sp. tritici]KAH9470032.1 hypothetical protein Pst134EA_007296 [Puccinia striiformis f. sp. tritici]
MVGDDDIDAGWISQPVIGLPPDLIAHILKHEPLQPRTWMAVQEPLGGTRYNFLSIFLHPDFSKRGDGPVDALGGARKTETCI